MLLFAQYVCPNKLCKRGRVTAIRGFWIFAKEHETACAECDGRGVVTTISHKGVAITIERDVVSDDDESVRVVRSLADSETQHPASLDAISKVENELDAAINMHLIIPLPLRPELEK